MVQTVDINGSKVEVNVHYPSGPRIKNSPLTAIDKHHVTVPRSFSYQYKISMNIKDITMFISSGHEINGICSGVLFNYYAKVEFSEKDSTSICTLLGIPYLDDNGCAMTYRAINMQVLWTTSMQDQKLERLDMQRWKNSYQDRIRCKGDITVQASSDFVVVRLETVVTEYDINNPC